MDEVSYVSSVVGGEHDSFAFVQGGSSTMHLALQHSISLHPDSVIVWMMEVIDTLMAMIIEASAVIIIL
jgi:hypothetical protein